MELINFYFANVSNRVRLLLTFFYLICVILMTQQILSWLGYHYTFPKEINLTVAINFVLSQQVLLPIMVFTIYIFISVFASSYFFRWLYKIALKTILRNHSSTQQSLDIRKEMTANGWIVMEKDRVAKGSNYPAFEESMKFMFYDAFNLGAMVRLLAAIAFNILIILIFSVHQTTLTKVLIVTNALWLFFCWLYVIGYILKSEYKPFYESYLNHLRYPDKYSYPLLYYTPDTFLKKDKTGQQKIN